MITIYDKKATDFSTLGKGALRPTECRIEEEAGGMYELTLVHPMTEDGRHNRIGMFDIVKAPAPVRKTPLIELETSERREIYRVATEGNRLNLRVRPDLNARIIAAYLPGTEVAKLGTDGEWMQVAILDGSATGWMWINNLIYVRTETAGGANRVVEPRQTRAQLFRIYSIEADSKLRTITARARHITYDLFGAVVVGEYSPEAVPAAQVCAELMARADHDVSAFRVYCAVDTPITAKYGGRNIINCLLDSEDGVATQAGAMVVRDNYDLFILPRDTSRSNVSLRYGKNLLSAAMVTDASGLITRIRPVGKDSDGEALYLPENDGFVDSTRIGEYPVIYSREMEYDVVVSDTVTKAQALTRLRSKARTDLTANDRPEVTLDADFVRLELTEQYRKLANAYALHLYDRVPVIDAEATISATVAMTRYIYDCIMDRYADTRLGDVYVDGVPEPSNPVTAEYMLTNSDSYAGGSWIYFDDNDVRQGMLNDARVRGCMWFDTETIRAELSGKTIVEAWLRLYAQKGVGRGVAVEVELYGTDMEYETRAGMPALSAGYGLIGTAVPGETALLPIPVQAVEDLVLGVISGLMVYSSDDELHDGESYSRNYARFSGSTSGDEKTMPVLTVMYQ